MFVIIALCSILGIIYPATATIVLKVLGDKRPIRKILEDL